MKMSNVCVDMTQPYNTVIGPHIVLKRKGERKYSYVFEVKGDDVKMDVMIDLSEMT